MIDCTFRSIIDLAGILPGEVNAACRSVRSTSNRSSNGLAANAVVTINRRASTVEHWLRWLVDAIDVWDG
ncbi:MAG: hypothetical protein ACK5S9_04660 [Roseiflexaceae bacterium]